MTRPIHLAPLDETGRPLPPIEPSSDVAQLLYLLEAARARGYKICPQIQIGTLVTMVEDLRQDEGRSMPSTPDPGPWAAAGYNEGDP